ncbi:MAG: zinc ABC transporter substrate-binding protein [Solirubrobacterales bacterium]|nr:zinc ABC transporter substrate-binding protein [Solirubrobacterales bacterium]
MTLSAALENPFDLFAPVFAQRALLAVLMLALVAAALGGAIVLRDLPFFIHAIGAGAYPVIVLGILTGVSIAISALAGALAFALFIGIVTGIGRAHANEANFGRRDALTGLAVAGALAVGAVLAARAGFGDTRLEIPPEALLFGSLLTVNTETLTALAIVTLVVVTTAWFAYDRWLAGGFDHGAAGHLGASRSDSALFACVAIGTGASLPVTGSLLTGALLIIPAATARMLTDRAKQLPLLIFALALVEGATGLYLSLNFDLPTGAAIAGVAGLGFFAVAGLLSLRSARTPLRLAASIALISFVAVAVGGCGGGATGETSDSDATLKVVSTTPQVADIVNRVGGDAVEVTTLLSPGADPHDYEPKRGAVAAISDADVVVRSGGDLDAWLLPAVKAANPAYAPVDLSRSVLLIPAGESGEGYNAHWYLAPQNVARATQRVRDELIKADPSARETFRTNATQYLDEIDASDQKLAKCASKIPAADRKLMAGHNDFAYLAQSFGFQIAAQAASSGGSEPSTRGLQDAVDQARGANVDAVIASKGAVTSREQQVAQKLRVPLLALYADNLTTGDDASTLLGAIEYDVDRIANTVTSGRVRCPATD